jgi:hypothetical protein
MREVFPVYTSAVGIKFITFYAACMHLSADDVTNNAAAVDIVAVSSSASSGEQKTKLHL